MPNSNWNELELFARGPVVVFRWRNEPGWPVEYVSPNAAEVFGYTAKQFLDGDVVYANLIHPDDLQRVSEEVMTGGGDASGSFVHKPYRIRHANGATRWLYDMTHVIWPEGASSPSHFLGYVVDITKQIEAENERHALQLKLLQTQKLESLGILAGGVAHDFNNFLTGILGEAELARMKLGNDHPEVAKRLASIETVALRAAEVTQQLLTYTGKRQNPPQPVRLDKVIREVVDMLGTVLSRGATLNLQLDPVRPIVADRAQMIQIVMNLLTNASDALQGKPGQIDVRLVEAEDPSGQVSLRLSVADTGCGMTPEVQSRLFDPFFTTKDSGRGLGMSAVQGILRAHGGDIAVESIPGKGTRFHVTLPA